MHTLHLANMMWKIPLMRIRYGLYFVNFDELVCKGICERCQSSVGNVTRYHENGVDKLLCSNCVLEIDDYYSVTYDKCNKPAHMRGNLIEHENEKICTVCMDEIRLKEN